MLIWFVLASVSKFGHYHARPFLAPSLTALSTEDDPAPLSDAACPDLHDIHLGWVLRAALTSVGGRFDCRSSVCSV